MTFFTFLHFTEQQYAPTAVERSYSRDKKTLKAQPYLELKRIYTVSNSQSNELLLLDAFRKVLAQIHAER